MKKNGLKLSIQKTKIMDPVPSLHATRWETMETMTDRFFCGSKITADGDCNHSIKRSLLLGRKAITNLDSILKSRDIALMTKVRLVKALVSQWSWMDVRRLSAKELMLSNYDVGEDS